MTPLHFASVKGDAIVAKLLMEAGANIDQANKVRHDSFDAL